MAVRELLRLGNPKLYEVCADVEQYELPEMGDVVSDLHETLLHFREQWRPARAVAAPQIGVMKRLIYMHIDEPKVLINPVISEYSAETVELWDDCMSFPELLVRVTRHRTCTIRYRDLDWHEHVGRLTDLSELLQHECDHLDGILAISRAIDSRSIILRSEKAFVVGETAN